MSHEHSTVDAKPCPICGGSHGLHSDNCGHNRPKDWPKDWPSVCPYCGGKNDAHTEHCPFGPKPGPKPKVDASCGYAEPADPLASEIRRLACSIEQLADSVNNNKQDAILQRLAQMENNIMSAIGDWSAKNGPKLDRIQVGLDAVQLLVEKLQNSPGGITPEDQALLDQIEAKIDAIATDADSVPAPPAA